MQQLSVDIEQRTAILFSTYHMRIPELVVKGLCSHKVIIQFCDLGAPILLFASEGVKVLESRHEQKTRIVVGTVEKHHPY